MTQVDTTGGRHGISEAESGLFARQATGLVREVSPLSAAIFNFSVSLPAYILAFSVFWILGAFPGANIYAAFWFTCALAVVFCIAFGLLSSAMPRTGGDYTLVSRLIHPVVGLISSFCVCFSVTLAIGAFGLAAATVVVGPGLTAVGLVANSSSLVDAGQTVQDSEAWKFVLGTLSIALISGVIAMGWRVATRFQNISFIVSTVGFLVAGIVLLIAGHGGFVDNFNEFAAKYTDSSNSYQQIIATAKKEGAYVEPGSDFANSIPAMGAIMGFVLFSYWSLHIAGEVRRARKLTITYVMVGVAIAVTATLTIYTLLFFHVFGTEFFASANALSGTDGWPFASPPYWVFLTSVAGGSSVLAWFLVLTFVPGLFLNLLINIAQPVRALFAYAFDGLIPRRVAAVSPKYRVPTVASVLIFLLSEVALAWAVWSASFITAISLGMLFGLISTSCLAISAIILPYKHTEIWRASATTKRLAGVPIISIAGVIALVGSIFGIWVYLHYEGLGVQNPNQYPIYLAVFVAAALALYYGAAAVRKREGIDLRHAYAEIPPE
jgi:APA family basic amino acid/polyamine antiporter